MDASGIFFVDAKGALDARRSGEVERLEAASFPRSSAPSNRSSRWSMDGRRSSRPAQELQRSLRALVAHLPQSERMLDESLEVLERRAEEAAMPLEALVAERDGMVARLQLRADELRAAVQEKALVFFEDQARRMREWAEETDPEAPPTDHEFAREVAAHIAARADDALAEWQTQTLLPLIAEHQEALVGEFDERARTFLEHAASLRLQIFAVGGPPMPSGDDGDGSAVGRLISSGGGLVLAGPEFRSTQAVRGVGMVLSGIITSTTLATGGLALLALPAVPILAAIASRLGRGSDRPALKAKRAIADQLAVEIRDSRPQRVEAIGAQLEKRLSEVREAVRRGLDREIDQVRQDLDAALRAKREGEASVAVRREGIASARPRIAEVSTRPSIKSSGTWGTPSEMTGCPARLPASMPTCTTPGACSIGSTSRRPRLRDYASGSSKSRLVVPTGSFTSPWLASTRAARARSLTRCCGSGCCARRRLPAPAWRQRSVADRPTSPCGSAERRNGSPRPSARSR